MADSAANRRGMALMLAAMACYAVNDAFVKLVAAALPPGQILAVRGAFATAIAVLIAYAARTPFANPRFGSLVGLRCALEVTTALASVMALARAPLATATAVMLTAPLMIGIATATLGWEPWRPARWLTALAGFAGVLMVLRPWEGQFAADAGIGLALLCAVSLAARDLVTRKIPPVVPSAVLGVLTTAAVLLSGIAIGLFERWREMPVSTITCLALAAVCTAFGNLALIAACREADLSMVTPLRYSLVVWATLLGFVVWGEVPGVFAGLGIVLICGAGIENARIAGRR